MNASNLTSSSLARSGMTWASSRDRSSQSDAATLERDIRAACERIPPLWTLRNFVAVNPFLGFATSAFPEATAAVERVFHARCLLPLPDYAQHFRSGRIDDSDLVSAARVAPRALRRPELGALPPESLAAELLADVLRESGSSEPGAPRTLTLAEAIDAQRGTGWAELIVGELSRWLAGRFDLGQAAWPQPGRDLPLFTAWRESARVDRNAELQGLRGFRGFASRLPRKPIDAISAVLGQLGVPTPARTEFLARQLASIGGWAGHVQRAAREAAAVGLEDSSIEALLAMRLAYDGALAEAFGTHDLVLAPAPAPAAGSAGLDSRERQVLWQLAFEHGFRRSLRGRLDAAPALPPASVRERPRLQAAFCIDVRSEVMRRHLESLDPRIQTIGFAGFFGMPIELQRADEDAGSARCPVLLQPSHRVLEKEARGPDARARLRLAREHHRVFTKLRKLTVGTFPLVETLGNAFGLRLLSDALGWGLSVTAP